MQRRQFLILSGSTLGGILLSQCAISQTPGKDASTFATVFSSQEGLLDINLDLTSHVFSLAGEKGNLLSYNQQIPGPRLEAYPGDRVRIHATNSLSAPTNLHYHGLHISPEGSADNIFLQLSPGETYTYEFTIPDNHYGTTGYYHPHLHGYVAQQVFGGLGAFLLFAVHWMTFQKFNKRKRNFSF